MMRNEEDQLTMRIKTRMIKRSFPDQKQTSARDCGAIVCRSYQSLCVVIRIAHIIIVILIFIIIIIFLILVIIVPLCITIFISLIITVVIIRIENIIIVAKTLVCMYVNRRRKRSLCLLVSKNECNCLMCSCVRLETCEGFIRLRRAALLVSLHVCLFLSGHIDGCTTYL